VGLAALCAAIALATSRLRRDREPTLGTVSHAWISEQRFGSTRDSRR
jgi:hypothetical protein